MNKSNYALITALYDSQDWEEFNPEYAEKTKERMELTADIASLEKEIAAYIRE